MLIHLVKRNPDLSGTKIRFSDTQIIWFVQTRKNGTPGGSKAQKGGIPPQKTYIYPERRGRHNESTQKNHKE